MSMAVATKGSFFNRVFAFPDNLELCNVEAKIWVVDMQYDTYMKEKRPNLDFIRSCKEWKQRHRAAFYAMQERQEQQSLFTQTEFHND
jgi:hypothetical protein